MANYLKVLTVTTLLVFSSNVLALRTDFKMFQSGDTSISTSYCGIFDVPQLSLHVVDFFLADYENATLAQSNVYFYQMPIIKKFIKKQTSYNYSRRIHRKIPSMNRFTKKS